MLPALVLLTDVDGRVLHANPPARALLGSCVDQQCCALLDVDCTAPEVAAGGYQDVGRVTANGVVGQAARSTMGAQFVIVIQPQGVAARDTEPLTPREREILQLVARGLTDVTVAARLGLQHTTVRSHMENVRRKLGVRSRSQAVARAVTGGML
ncbi:MAG: LuxR C-terminal-related transcriptional regulator [Pseudomonadota bacterium]|nr:LuxR C-terminal-related transcriptional regulator [Pseudomonadota bacterium]